MNIGNIIKAISNFLGKIGDSIVAIVEATDPNGKGGAKVREFIDAMSAFFGVGKAVDTLIDELEEA